MATFKVPSVQQYKDALAKINMLGRTEGNASLPPYRGTEQDGRVRPNSAAAGKKGSYANR